MLTSGIEIIGKFALIAALLCGALRAQSPVTGGGPALTIELRDDNSEQVTFESGGSTLVSPELREAAFAAAGCQSADAMEGFRVIKVTCRHAVTRSGSITSASWDFSPLAKALANTGVTQLTTCVEHPDWPYAENDRRLPLQRIPRGTAHCDAWPVSRITGPLEMRVKAGYQTKDTQPVAWAAVAFAIVFAAAGLLLGRGSDFLRRHTIMTFWTASCFVWMALVLWCDGLRMLSLRFGSTGDSRWLCAGLVAAAPPFFLAFLLAWRQEAALSAKLRKNALFCLAVFVVTAVVLCGVPQVDPLELKAYALTTPVVMALVRRRASGGGRLAAAPQGDLLTSFHSLAAKAGIAPPRLMFFQIPSSHAAGAAAVVDRRRMLLITSNLLAVCSKREVDAILGHELAHFVQRRRAVLFLFLFSMLGLMVTGAFIEQRLQVWLVPGVVASVLLLSAWTRHLEFAADRFGARLSGDPEAMAASLVKLGVVNQTPGSGSAVREMFLSHPWTDKRVKRLGVRFEAALASPGEPKYAARAGAGTAGMDRPIALYARELTKYSQFLLFRIWVVALAAGIVAGLLPSSDPISALVFAAAVAIGFFAITALWSLNMERVGRDVRARLSESHGADWEGAAFCGMSPGVGRTVFDTGYHWDVGLLRISDSALCYAGDRASFALPRSSIRMIELRPGPRVRWTPSQVVCIHLADSSPEGVPRSIAMEMGPGGRYKTRRRLMREFHETLQQWHTAADAPSLDCVSPSIESVKWPKGRLIVTSIVSSRVFWRYAAAAVAPVLAASWAIWGWDWTPEATLPAVVAFVLVALFLGRGVLLRDNALLAQAQAPRDQSGEMRVLESDQAAS